MADLASTDVTVHLATLGTQAGDVFVNRDVTIAGGKRHAHVKITFGDGAKTYPAGGVPMPAYTAFFMKRNLEDLTLSDPASASAIVAKYDTANNKIRLYNPGAELAASVDAPPAMTLYATAVGW